MKIVAAKKCTISGLGSFAVGDTIDTDKAFAEKLVARGIAKKATNPVIKKKEEAVESED
jgi:hypothetical protein